VTYFLETYGCQMNSAESAALDLVLRRRGWTAAGTGAEADLVLLNTCAVRATAEQRVLGRIALYGALKKKRPFTLGVTGCMAQRLGEALRERAVDFVMPLSARRDFPALLERLEQGLPPRTGAPPPPPPEAGEQPVFSFSPLHLGEGRFRAFLPIMQGCNNFCSYCIVPYVRGREVSRDPASILREIRLLGDRGVREITLLGQNVNSYRWEGAVPGPGGAAGFNGALDFPGLLELCAEALEGTPIRWVRFLSSHPKDLSPRAIRVMAGNPRFCRHLHLCVQHGSNAVLAAMNRRYTRERYLELAGEIRGAMPGISLSTDILVGFPGETEADLELTLDLMEQVKFLYAYMYHFNPREGTAAFGLPDRISGEVKGKRLSRIIELQRRHTRELLRARVGSRERVLIEGISRKNADELISRTERDEMAVLPGIPSMIGSFAEVYLVSLRGNTFLARRADSAE
jgi:tRNA-2-methylthio-N6-dimethylallyladenosine synthase